MNDFDKYIKKMAKKEQLQPSEEIIARIEQTLESLPQQISTEKGKSTKSLRIILRTSAAVACFAFVMLFLLPNISSAYAQTLEQIPVIGAIVRIVTIKNYFYSDNYHEMNIDVPTLGAGDNDADELNSINYDIKELTDTLIDRFYNDLEAIGDMGHSSVYVDYETVTDTAAWFTLKIRVYEAAGSSNTYYKYYHFNKLTGKTVKLGDIAKNDRFYTAVEQDIKKQMAEAMEKDNSLKYWVEDSIFGDNIVSVDSEHNFYWNKDGNLVIPFDKYEVAPGYMSTPEFAVDKAVINEFMKEEFKDINMHDKVE
ncbi:MAG: DUF3298 domain-containing protein [Clostridiales bacterium]|nr:DUF3298 domain-containing protein [Clostridiales bacterium]